MKRGQATAPDGSRYRGYMGSTGPFDVVGTVRGQPVRAAVIPLSSSNFEVLPRPGTQTEPVDTEVAGLVNRMVHAVAFQSAVEDNRDLLAGLEAFQKKCWERELVQTREGGQGEEDEEPPGGGVSSAGEESGGRRGGLGRKRQVKRKTLTLDTKRVNESERKGSTPRRAAGQKPPGKQPAPKGSKERISQAYREKAQVSMLGVAMPRDPPITFDESLMLDPYFSLSKATSKGLKSQGFKWPQRSAQQDVSTRDAYREVAREAPHIPVSHQAPPQAATIGAVQGPTAFAPLVTKEYLSDSGSDPFVKRLSELQYLCSETLKGERKGGKASGPAAPVAESYAVPSGSTNPPQPSAPRSAAEGCPVSAYRAQALTIARECNTDAPPLSPDLAEGVLFPSDGGPGTAEAVPPRRSSVLPDVEVPLPSPATVSSVSGRSQSFPDLGSTPPGDLDAGSRDDTQGFDPGMVENIPTSSSISPLPPPPLTSNATTTARQVNQPINHPQGARGPLIGNGRAGRWENQLSQLQESDKDTDESSSSSSSTPEVFPSYHPRVTQPAQPAPAPPPPASHIPGSQVAKGARGGTTPPGLLNPVSQTSASQRTRTRRASMTAQKRRGLEKK